MRKWQVVLMVVLALTATTAFGEEGRGYVGLSTGIFLPNDSRLTDTTGDTADVSYKAGFALSGVAGYEIGNGLRLEGELAYKNADLDRIRVAGGSGDVNSDVWSLGFLANAFYDIKTGSMVTPYLGGGIGFASVNVGDGTINGIRVWKKSDDTAFAYQAVAGLGFEINKNVAVDLNYRFYGTEDVKFEMAKADFSSNSVMVGFRYRY